MKIKRINRNKGQRAASFSINATLKAPPTASERSLGRPLFSLGTTETILNLVNFVNFELK